jgi:enamine deaminase RidA (YjgF/YER057c/UK114 family)
MPFLEVQELDNAEEAPLAGSSAVSLEIVLLQAQVRTLRRVAFGSLAVSMLALAVLAQNMLAGTGAARSPLNTMAVTAKVPEIQQLWDDNEVIIPYGFDECESASEPPQIAPIRKNGEFLFLSGILGYDVPCKTAVQDPAKQIRAAFKWAEDSLEAAGVKWSDVLTVTSYHVNISQHQRTFADMREKFLTEPPYPAWTAVGVSGLYFPNEIFEMTLIARKVCLGLECDR